MLLLGALASRAGAGLGGDSSSVTSDARTLGASNASASAAAADQPDSLPAASNVQSFVLRSSTGEKFTWREFTTDTNLKVREYVTPKGKVFGVAWQGPQPPDLHVLLSSFFGDWKAAAQSSRTQSIHHSEVRTSSLIVQMGGQMGFVTGRAWVPALVPQGVDAGETVR
ncbi:MAG: DUF2844 domain-containing protein [Candidatus Binataceae bacterium]